LDGVLSRLRWGLIGLILVAALGGGTLLYAERPSSAPEPAPALGGNAPVLDWSHELVRIQSAPGPAPAALPATRAFAILQTAIYQAVAAPGPRPDAAASAAGHDVLAALYPGFRAELDALQDRELAAIPEGRAKQAGLAAGRLAALGRLALGQGSDPLVLRRASQFRSPAPELGNVEFRQALTEVFRFGEDVSSFRTADQALAARFWSAPIWVTWNQIAEGAVTAHHAGLLVTAQIFAELDLALADTATAFVDAKSAYNLQRPVVLIREVESQAAWTPLLATPGDPSYPGAHSAESAAAATVLASFFGDRERFGVTSEAVLGVTRHFDSYSAAASEAGLSRIYGGVHTRIDHNAGVVLGHEVATLVVNTFPGDSR
jgi:membrane-associated phospholipid phosphatase